MDSLTQAVLGGAVGHAVAGKTLGRRAAAWGAVAGTLPDLDVLTYPFLDTAGQLLIHRGVTHGLAFGLVVGPVLGWLGWRFARWRASSKADSLRYTRAMPVFFSMRTRLTSPSSANSKNSRWVVSSVAFELIW